MTPTSALAQVQHTVVFPAGDGGGNPCPIVFGADDWPTEQLQATAAGFGHETGFVLAPQSGGDVRLRYFVPRHEMEMCVHATVAAVVLLGRAGAIPETASIETPLGMRTARWEGPAGTAIIEQARPTLGAPISSVGEVLEVLGLSEADLDGVDPVQSVSTARAKLMIPLVDERALDAIVLDAPAAWELCDQLDVTGLYPFTVTSVGADAAARQFPRRAGFDEDPATGVAACALGAYLATHRRSDETSGWRRWHIAQGRAMGRPSMIEAEALIGEDGGVTATRVGGEMRVVGEIEQMRSSRPAER
jgi:trans-2,3-dihydro-3-hydroxyanthranilate isomerase